MQRNVRRIYRVRDDSQVAGVCGGLADYLEVDPVFVRVVFLTATFLTGVVPGLLSYAAAWILVPREPIALPAAPVEPVQSGVA